jgi:hypothetical protein
VDFTREPIIETVITPKEGCKLVIRSSKTVGQEEYFVDAIEVVSFGSALFFRSTERPKSFLVPVSDYEVVEVRDTRMVLKHVGPERTSIKIGARDQQQAPQRQHSAPKAEPSEPRESEEVAEPRTSEGGRQPDKKRDRRRHQRRRRGGREDGVKEEVSISVETSTEVSTSSEPINTTPDHPMPVEPKPSVLTTLLPPPPTLISETIARYKESDLFKGAFFTKEEKVNAEPAAPSLERVETAGYTEGSQNWDDDDDILYPDRHGYSPNNGDDENGDVPVNRTEEANNGNH